VLRTPEFDVGILTSDADSLVAVRVSQPQLDLSDRAGLLNLLTLAGLTSPHFFDVTHAAKTDPPSRRGLRFKT
jgi:hypothetical protein